MENDCHLPPPLPPSNSEPSKTTAVAPNEATPDNNSIEPIQVQRNVSVGKSGFNKLDLTRKY